MTRSGGRENQGGTAQAAQAVQTARLQDCTGLLIYYFSAIEIRCNKTANIMDRARHVIYIIQEVVQPRTRFWELQVAASCCELGPYTRCRRRASFIVLIMLW
jgi:hypothetical protein